MTWETYEQWWTLFSGADRIARLYRPHYAPKWKVRFIASGDGVEGLCHLDPALTEEEAKLVVQTLAGAQL